VGRQIKGERVNARVYRRTLERGAALATAATAAAAAAVAAAAAAAAVVAAAAEMGPCPLPTAPT
jgi:hypothetical protein